MVADSVQSSNTKLENDLKILFPVNRLDWLSAENQFMAKAAIEECQQHILGTYVEKPMFPLIEVPQLSWQTDPTDPTKLAVNPITGLRIQSWKLME